MRFSLPGDRTASILFVVIILFSDMTHKEDTYSYKGWLNSDVFLKRAFAIYGYSFVPVLIIFGVVFGLALVVGLISGLISATV